jgi:hypothetical protein
MSFRDDVVATSDISGCYQCGLNGIKSSERSYFRFSDTRKIDGSVDIDSCVKSKYPYDNRWDYMIGYNDEIYFVEIHPASTSEVRTMISKLTWLKQWLRDQSSPLEGSFHWVASGKVAIAKGSPQARKLACSGIVGPKRVCEGKE